MFKYNFKDTSPRFTSFCKVFLFVLLFIQSIGVAQFKKDSLKRVKYVILPIGFRSPETYWAFGISSSVSFKTSYKNDSLTRTSTIQALAMLTQRQQNVQVIDATIFFPKERYIFSCQISHSFYPDRYWGIGQNSKEFPKVKGRGRTLGDYDFEQLYFFPHLKKKIAKDFFVGALYEFQKVYRLNYAKESLFDSARIDGKQDHIMSGFGASVSYDTRNSSYWPTKGILIQGTFTYFNNYFGSTYNDLKTTLDIRYFKKLFRHTVIAAQLYNYTNEGQPPIRELAMLGGANNMRGLYQGRFRDHNMTTLIAEYRVPIWKRFSAVVFGGIGNVYRKVNELVTNVPKHTFGGGIRFALLPKEKLNIRLDYGYYNQYNSGFYFTVGECF
jgi:outer membrane protein assembly factor BamA